MSCVDRCDSISGHFFANICFHATHSFKNRAENILFSIERIKITTYSVDINKIRTHFIAHLLVTASNFTTIIWGQRQLRNICSKLYDLSPLLFFFMRGNQIIYQVLHKLI